MSRKHSSEKIEQACQTAWQSGVIKSMNSTIVTGRLKDTSRERLKGYQLKQGRAELNAEDFSLGE